MGNIVKDIKGLMSQMVVVDVCFQPRKGNNGAHLLAHFGLKERVGSCWDIDAPFSLWPMLERDRED